MEKLEKQIFNLHIKLNNYFSHNLQVTVLEKILFAIDSGFTSPKQIMKHLCLLKPNMAAAAAKLVKLKLIAAHKNALDARKTTYSLTKQGSDVINKINTKILHQFKMIEEGTLEGPLSTIIKEIENENI